MCMNVLLEYILNNEIVVKVHFHLTNLLKYIFTLHFIRMRKQAHKSVIPGAIIDDFQLSEFESGRLVTANSSYWYVH